MLLTTLVGRFHKLVLVIPTKHDLSYINLIRENKEKVIENIKRKFQDEKIPLVEEIYNLDKEYREVKLNMDTKRAEKNKF